MPNTNNDCGTIGISIMYFLPFYRQHTGRARCINMHFTHVHTDLIPINKEFHGTREIVGGGGQKRRKSKCRRFYRLLIFIYE